MSQRTFKLISNCSAAKESKQRLKLKVFFDLLRPHIGAIQSAQEVLKELSKQSDTLPLAVVPIRLTLLTALLDANAQIAKLKGLLFGFSEESGTVCFNHQSNFTKLSVG